MNGVSAKSVKAIGQINVRITFRGTGGKCGFFETTFYVFDLDVPVLVGLPILQHKYVTSYTVASDSLTFHRRFYKQNVDQRIPRLDEKSNVFQIAKTVKPVNGTLDEKVKWLNDHLELKVPVDHKSQELEPVVDLLLGFADIFGHETCVQGLFPDAVPIKTKPGEVINKRQHPIAHHFQEQLEHEISSMLENGVIEICPDPKGWNSPIIAVRKKNGKVRVCANFKNTINCVLAPDSDVFQMPSTDTIFHEIGSGNTYFSSLDLRSGYWHLAINPEDRHKTAFQYKNCTYQFKRVPFGLKNAGDLFNRAVAKAMAGVANRANMKSYVDDVMVYGKSFATYLATLEQIFTACRKFNMRLSGSKCSFLQTKAKFLGRIVDETGYKPDPDYVEGILEMKPPETKRQLSACIGRFNWLRDYISPGIGEAVAEECFSHIVSEMTCLNKKDKKFTWTREANDALEKCKETLSSPKVIAYADFTLPFCLVTDASDVAMGAVLLQKQGNHQRIIATGSKTFNDTERNWSATEREGYAIVFFVERFKYFLSGKPFILMTDHKALTAMDRKIIANVKMARWQDRLREFDFVVQYIPGKENVIADMFSRPYSKRSELGKVTTEIEGRFYTFGDNGQSIQVYVPSWISAKIPKEYLMESPDVDSSQVLLACSTNINAETVDAKLQEMVDEQSKDPTIARLMGYLRGNNPITKWRFDMQDDREKEYWRCRRSFFLHEPSGALMIRYAKREFFVLGPHQVKKYLRIAHDENGHFGAERVKENMYNLWWPGKIGDITNYCASCVPCLKRKGNYMQPVKLPSGHLQQGTRPFQHITIDFISLDPSARGKRNCLTIMCNFSRFLKVVPSVKSRAVDALHGLRDWILDYDVPETIGSDRGTHFVNDLISQMCDSLHIDHKIHAAFRPQSSGNIERAHRTLKNSLWIMKHAQGLDWEECVPYVVRAMNRSINAAIRISPFECVYGKKPDLTGTQLDSEASSLPAAYGRRIKYRLEVAHRAVRVAQKGANEVLDLKSVPHIKTLDLDPGDNIYLKREQFVDSENGKMPYIGPFEVIASHDYTVQIDKGDGDIDFVHRTHCVKEIPRHEHLSEENQQVQGNTTEELAGAGIASKRSKRLAARPSAQSHKTAAENTDRPAGTGLPLRRSRRLAARPSEKSILNVSRADIPTLSARRFRRNDDRTTENATDKRCKPTTRRKQPGSASRRQEPSIRT